MRFGRAIAAVIGLCFTASPTFALFCDPTDAGGMACCQNDAADCNKPAQADDCCKSAPAGPESGATIAKADRLAKPALTTALPDVAIVPMAVSTLTLSAVSRPGGHSLVLSIALSPPRNSVLRV